MMRKSPKTAQLSRIGGANILQADRKNKCFLRGGEIREDLRFKLGYSTIKHNCKYCRCSEIIRAQDCIVQIATSMIAHMRKTKPSLSAVNERKHKREDIKG